MGNRFGTDILIQAPDPKAAAAFYVKQLGFLVVTGETWKVDRPSRSAYQPVYRRGESASGIRFLKS